MASSSPSSFLLLLAAVSLLLAPLFAAVSADEQLVETTCRKTMNYDACIKCVKQFIDYKNADLPGLVSLVTECGSSDVHILAQTFSDLSSKGSLVGNVKKAYTDCKDHFDQAAANFAVARQYLQGKDFGNAKASVGGAEGFTATCRGELGQAGSLGPFDSDIGKVTVVCQVASNIIDQI